MKSINALLVSMGLVGVVIWIGIALGLLAATFYGLYLAFSASILLGVIVFLVEPSPLIIGLVMLFFHKNLAQMLMDFLTK